MPLLTTAERRTRPSSGSNIYALYKTLCPVPAEFRRYA
jgi:hypothetical protein